VDHSTLISPANDPPRPARPGGTFPPVAAIAALDDPSGAAHWTGARLRMRMRGDAQLLLAIAVALPVLAMEGISDLPQRPIALLGPAVFIAAQLWLTTLRAAPAWLPTARLALCLAFISLANIWIDPSGTWPLSALAIPVVALAAANGGRGGIVVALAAYFLGADPQTALQIGQQVSQGGGAAQQQGAREIDRRRDADQQPDVEREVARARAVGRPARAQAHAVVEHDRAENEKERGDCEFRALLVEGRFIDATAPR